MKNKTTAQTKKKKISSLLLAASLLIPLAYLIIWENFIHTQPLPDFQRKLDSVRAVLSTPSQAINNSEATQLMAEIANLEKLVQTEPSENNYINLGLAYFKAKRYYDCIDATRLALKINPNSSLAYNNIGCSYNELGLYGEGAKACEKALKIKPDFELAANNLKVSQNGINETKKQLSTLKSRKGLNADSLILLGNLYYKLADYKSAIQTYERVLKINPNHAMAYNNICSCYNSLEQYDKAIEYCNKALAADSTLQLARNNREVAIRKKQNSKH